MILELSTDERRLTQMRKLPEGWEWKKLGEIITLEYGKPLPDEKRRKDGKYIVYGANGEKDRTNDFYYDKKSIIVGRKGSAGEVTITKDKFWPLDVTYFLKFDEQKYDLYFLYHTLVSLELQKLAKGVKPGINRNEVYSIKVRIPPLSDQKRIVAILDEAFTVIDKAKDNAEKLLANAKELFESYLNDVFIEKVHGTKFETLESLCELVTDCEHKTAPLQETGYPSIRTPNIGKGELLLDGVNRVSYETYIEWTRRAIPKAGDLILGREAPAGNIAIIPDNLEVCLGQRTVLIRPKKDKLNSNYLSYLILSREVQKILLSHSTGATVQHINMKDIRAFKIFELLDLVKQKNIVNKLDVLKNETKRLESFYQQKITALDELKKSILKKAFEGEL